MEVTRMGAGSYCGAPQYDNVLQETLGQVTPTGTEKLVCDDIARRQQLGIVKYGTTVQSNPLTLREWLEHAYQEALDMAIYLRRAMQEVDNTPELQEPRGSKQG